MCTSPSHHMKGPRKRSLEIEEFGSSTYIGHIYLSRRRSKQFDDLYQSEIIDAVIGTKIRSRNRKHKSLKEPQAPSSLKK